MAETTATRPTRTRAAKATTAKAAPAAKAPAKEEAAARPDVVVTLTHAGATKNYEKFVADEGSGVKGTLYFPLGTETVRVAGYGVPETA
jgi:hypothetical protein